MWRLFLCSLRVIYGGIFIYVSCLNWKLLHAWSMLVWKLLCQYVWESTLAPSHKWYLQQKRKCSILVNTHFYDGAWCFPMYVHYTAEAMIRLKKTCSVRKIGAAILKCQLPGCFWFPCLFKCLRTIMQIWKLAYSQNSWCAYYCKSVMKGYEANESEWRPGY